jgi:N-terminal domain of NWD NACHT-NTPase
MTGMDTSQPAPSSTVPVSMASQSPEQVARSPGPSASSGQRPATTVSEILPSPIASPAPTAFGAQPTTSDTVPFTSLSLPERLWNQAYEDLKAKEDKWVVAYERILSRELKRENSSSTDLESQKNEIEHRDPTKRRSQMEELVQAGLRRRREIETQTRLKKAPKYGMDGEFRDKGTVSTACGSNAPRKIGLPSWT